MEEVMLRAQEPHLKSEQMRLRIDMFSGITPERLLNMTDQEQRWFDNVKKAFHENDRAYTEGRLANRGLEEACKAIDTAKTLRRSLRGEGTTTNNNKAKFVEFLNLEVPDPTCGGMQIQLIDSRRGQPVTYSFAELVYAIRCMIHEGENLNAAEGVDYHILLDWGNAPKWAPTAAGPVSGTIQDPSMTWALPRAAYAGAVSDGRLLLNGHFVWGRVREILAKFITGIDGMISFSQGGSFSIGIDPPLGSVRPAR
jgi:hypothetical protein